MMRSYRECGLGREKDAGYEEVSLREKGTWQSGSGRPQAVPYMETSPNTVSKGVLGNLQNSKPLV